MRAWVALVALGLAGCTTSAQMYPANDLAQSVGAPRVQMRIYGTGSGPMTVTMPDGEALQGRYSVNVTGSQSFGSLYGWGYGAGGFGATGFANTMGYTSPAVADATGPKTTIHCEVMNNNVSGHGNGVCETNAGARYRVQY